MYYKHVNDNDPTKNIVGTAMQIQEMYDCTEMDGKLFDADGEEIPTIEIDNCLVPHWPDITNTQEL